MLGGVWARTWPSSGHKNRKHNVVGEEQEPDNAVNKFAMKVVKNNERFLVCWCLVVRVKQKLIA